MGDFVRSYKINDNWKNEFEKYPKSEKFQYGYVGGKEKKVCQNW